MSDATAAIRDQLEANAGVAAIVGTRIRRGWVDSTDAKPYILITATAGGSQLHHMTAAIPLANTRIDIHCVASSRGGANALSEAVREALDGLPATMGDQDLVVEMIHLGGPAIEFDEDPKDGSQETVYRDILAFNIWHKQSVPTA
jgi:hypothetical protein